MPYRIALLALALALALAASPACDSGGASADTSGAAPSNTVAVEESPTPKAAAPAPTPKPEAAAARAAVGEAAPDFELADTDGKTHKLSTLRGKTVVLEWFNPDCPFVRAAHTKGPLKDMAKQRANDQLVWLSINSSAAGKQGNGAERNRAAKGEYAIGNPVLLDESGVVGRTYGAEKTPHMFVIDPAGKLVYRGGLDNAPMAVVDAARPRLPDSREGDHVNYVDAALADLKQGHALRLAETPAYGCSVKYGD